MPSQKMRFIDEQYVESKNSYAQHQTFIAEIKKTIRTESGCCMIITSKLSIEDQNRINLIPITAK